MKNFLLKNKSWLVDLPILAIAFFLAFFIRFEFNLDDRHLIPAMQTWYMAVLGMSAGLYLFKIQRQSWRYFSLPDIRRLGFTILLGALISSVIILGLRVEDFPRSVLILHAIFSFLGMICVRAIWRSYIEKEKKINQKENVKNIVIIGGIDEANGALLSLKNNPEYKALAIISEKNQDAQRTLQGLKIYSAKIDDENNLENGQKQIEELIEKIINQTQVKSLLITSPAGKLRRSALMTAARLKLNWFDLPNISDNKIDKPLKTVNLHDLLQRAPVKLNDERYPEVIKLNETLKGLISGGNIIVTGAAGSIGSELCNQIAKLSPAKLICIDTSEYGIYELEQKLKAIYPDLQIYFHTSNVRDKNRLNIIFNKYKPQAVFHAAAYKHVPLMEDVNAIEALQTNAIGTYNAAKSAAQSGVKSFVLISTDKAVNPTNIMGASKRLAEILLQTVARDYPATSFAAVRFGNVLGSSGSVVPLFTKQIEKNQPLTVTHPDIVRYFMTISEAVSLVLLAGAQASQDKEGHIFVLDMGEPVKIAELARMMIELAGKTTEEVPIIFTGLRAGEKLYEECLATGENTIPCPHPQIFKAKTRPNDEYIDNIIEISINQINNWANQENEPDIFQIKDWLKEKIPEYQYKNNPT